MFVIIKDERSIKNQLEDASGCNIESILDTVLGEVEASGKEVIDFLCDMIATERQKGTDPEMMIKLVLLSMGIIEME